MQQLAAVNSAVKSASRVFFREYAAACMAEMGGGEEPSEVKRDRMVQEMINLLDKTP
jgi:DNA-binding FrmR family transcriptional regulator